MAESDAWWDANHDHIQWVFPTREPSDYNPDAPILTVEDINAIRNSYIRQERLRLSFRRYLNFLGLEEHNQLVQVGPNFEARKWVWRNFNHNWLRITRMITSLRLCGLEPEAKAFYECICKMRQDGTVKEGTFQISENSFKYWEAAMKFPVE